MGTTATHPQENRTTFQHPYQSHGDKVYGQAGPDASPCVAACATAEDAQVLVSLLNSFQQEPAPGDEFDRPEWFERRGNMVYGEDTGPGTAPHIATCKTAIDANNVVMLLCELVSD